MGLFEQFFGASSALTEQPRERRLLVSSLSRGEGRFLRRARKNLSRATDQLQDIRYRSMGELTRPASHATCLARYRPLHPPRTFSSSNEEAGLDWDQPCMGNTALHHAIIPNLSVHD